MLLGLLLHTLQGIDQQQRPFCPGRTGDHVLEKLLVTRCIDDDIVSPLPGEECPRCIDGNALLLLFKKGIKQEGVLELLPLLPAYGLNLFKLAIRQRSRVCIETPQQRRLPVVHMPHDHNVQIVRWFCIGRCHAHVPDAQTGRSARPHVRNNRRRSILTHPIPSCWNRSFSRLGMLRNSPHRERSWMLVAAFCIYMYPSFRSNSIPRPSSCARPDRSATVVCRNSSIMSST